MDEINKIDENNKIDEIKIDNINCHRFCQHCLSIVSISSTFFCLIKQKSLKRPKKDNKRAKLIFFSRLVLQANVWPRMGKGAFCPLLSKAKVNKVAFNVGLILENGARLRSTNLELILKMTKVPGITVMTLVHLHLYKKVLLMILFGIFNYFLFSIRLWDKIPTDILFKIGKSKSTQFHGFRQILVPFDQFCKLWPILCNLVILVFFGLFCAI